MKKILFISSVFLSILSSRVFSTHLPISSLAQIMRPNDSQGIALGLTGASYPEGLFSPYSNPAGLSFLSKFELAFSHIPSIKMGKKNIEINGIM